MRVSIRVYDRHAGRHAKKDGLVVYRGHLPHAVIIPNDRILLFAAILVFAVSSVGHAGEPVVAPIIFAHYSRYTFSLAFTPSSVHLSPRNALPYFCTSLSSLPSCCPLSVNVQYNITAARYSKRMETHLRF